MKISVIMPVYNTKEEYLTAAVESVLNQSFSDFELIVVDDGSREDCLECVTAYDDKRIRIIKNEQNFGPSISSNRAIEVANGEYIARMDSDDISLPNRFEKQVSFMDANPEVVVCGTACKRIGDGHVYPFLKNDIPRELLQIRLLTANINLANPTAFIRKSVFEKNGVRYDESIRYSLDYAMWVECIKLGEIRVIPEVLLEYREHEEQVSKSHRREQVECAKHTRMKQIKELGISFDAAEEECFFEIPGFKDPMEMAVLDGVLKKIEDANRERHLYDEKYLHLECARLWNAGLRKRNDKVRTFLRNITDQRTWEVFRPLEIRHIMKYQEMVRTDADR